MEKYNLFCRNNDGRIKELEKEVEKNRIRVIKMDWKVHNFEEALAKV